MTNVARWEGSGSHDCVVMRYREDNNNCVLKTKACDNTKYARCIQKGK